MNTEQQISRTKDLANQLQLNVDFIFHEESGKTTTDAERALGVSADKIIKTLVLYDSKKLNYIGVIISGDSKLDTKKLKEISGAKKLSFASNDQIKELTGFEIGGVPPFAVQFCNKCYIDSHLIDKEILIGAGGSEYCGMKFSPKELISKLSIFVENITL